MGPGDRAGASQGIRPALTIEAIQRDRRGGDIRLLDRAPNGVLPRVARREHVDFVGSCDLLAIPGQEEDGRSPAR